MLGYPLEDEHWISYRQGLALNGPVFADPNSPMYVRAQAFEGGVIMWDADINQTGELFGKMDCDYRIWTNNTCYESPANSANCLKLWQAVCR
jgi:hypothetical protein